MIPRRLTAAIFFLGSLSAGCGREERAPFQVGGRQVKDWVADLQSPKATVRRQAVHKLGNVGDADPSAAGALTVALRDIDPLVRHDAVLGVLKLQKPGDSIINVLESLAKDDPQANVREIAQKALAKLKGSG